MRRLRRVHASRYALADFAQTGAELGNVAVFRLIWRAAEVPHKRVRILRIAYAACRPDVFNDRSIAFLWPCARKQPVGDGAALQRFILVMVRRYETGHDDGARAVDDFGVRGGDGRRDFGDHFAVDQNVGSFEVSNLRVERQYDPSPKQNTALPSVSDQIFKVRGRRGTQVTEWACVLALRRFAATSAQKGRASESRSPGPNKVAPIRKHGQ